VKFLSLAVLVLAVSSAFAQKPLKTTTVDAWLEPNWGSGSNGSFSLQAPGIDLFALSSDALGALDCHVAGSTQTLATGVFPSDSGQAIWNGTTYYLHGDETGQPWFWMSLFMTSTVNFPLEQPQSSGIWSVTVPAQMNHPTIQFVDPAMDATNTLKLLIHPGQVTYVFSYQMGSECAYSFESGYFVSTSPKKP
jgi:hypothetical protein